MIRVEAERRFPVPVEQGFAYITDLRNWPEYWPGLVRVEPESRWQEPGDRVRLVLRLLGRAVELNMVLVRLEPNRLVTYESTQRGLPDVRHERHFEPDGEGFRYRIVVEYEPRPGLRGLLDRTLVARAVRRAAGATLDKLEGRFTAHKVG
jgi:uncharacterized protein YndB with AHSA1/START domain